MVEWSLEWIVVLFGLCTYLLNALCRDPEFATTAIGKRILVLRVWMDLNRTAFAFESFDGSDDQQANEAVAKSMKGRILPRLDDAKQEAWYGYALSQQDEQQDGMTYDTYLKDHVYKCGNDTKHPDYSRLKETLYAFSDPGQPGAQYRHQVEQYKAALLDKTLFSLPFRVFLLEMKRRTCALTFHTFGQDMSKARAALGSSAWKHASASEFVVTYCPGTDAPLYTQRYVEDDVAHYVAASLSEYDFCWMAIENAQQAVFFVQENYARWAEARKLAYAGKRASLFAPRFSAKKGLCSFLSRLFTIVVGVVYDDVDCWNAQGPNVVRVAPYFAACDTTYFTRTLRTSSPMASIGFWCYVCFATSVLYTICCVVPMIWCISALTALCSMRFHSFR